MVVGKVLALSQVSKEPEVLFKPPLIHFLVKNARALTADSMTELESFFREEVEEDDE